MSFIDSIYAAIGGIIAYRTIVGFLPGVIAAIIILIIAWIVGRIVGKLVSAGLDRVGVDDALRKTVIGK